MNDCSKFNFIQRLREFSNCLRSMIFKSIINGMKLPLYYGILQIVTICCFNCSTIHFGQGKAKEKKIVFAKRWKLPMFQKQGDIKVQTSWKGMAGGTPPTTQGTTPSTYPSHPNILPTRIYAWTTKPNVITSCHPKKHSIYSQGKDV